MYLKLKVFPITSALMAIFISSFIFTLTIGSCFSQDSTKTKPYIFQEIDKKECKKIINERVHFLKGTWDFVRADFRDTNLRLPITDHSLSFTNHKFQVSNNSKPTPIQSGKIKITKDKAEVLEFCYPLLWFGNIDKPWPDDWEHNSDESFELDTYYLFYLVTKCDKDSLVIYSPVGKSFKLNKSGQVIKRYVRHK
jgi:hypothetical protein